MSNSSSVTVTAFDPDQYNMSSSGGYTISLSPNYIAVPSYDFEHLRPHTQMDLFEKLIETDWVAASSLFQMEGEDSVTEARDYYIEHKEYLKDCRSQGWLKTTFDDHSQRHAFWFVGSDVDYTWWKMRWSEYFDHSFQIGIQI